ncbi:FADD protein, partial [Psilopogon haemacephalus]|nr:FADD protein [Psilopogon haemacephalus]
MDPFLSLLHSFSSSLTDRELSDMKFLCRHKIGKRKLEAVQSGDELFTILLEQQNMTREDVAFLEELLRNIKREDLLSRLTQFMDEGEVMSPENQPDPHEKPMEVICDNVGRDWKMLIRKLDVSDVRMDRIVAANPRDLREQLLQSLREWQRWRGRDAKVADLIRALRGCNMNLVADKVEQ